MNTTLGRREPRKCSSGLEQLRKRDCPWQIGATHVKKKEEKQSCQLPAVTSVVQWQIRFGSLPPLFSVLWVFLSQWGCLYICNLN